MNILQKKSIRKTVQRLHVSTAQPPSPPIETREWNTVETHTFVWDGNNIVLEKVAFADGTSHMFEYFWGMDKSGAQTDVPRCCRNGRDARCPLSGALGARAAENRNCTRKSVLVELQCSEDNASDS